MIESEIVTQTQYIEPSLLNHHYIQKNKAVLMHSAVEGWPAQSWTFEKVRVLFGDKQIRIRGGSRCTWQNLCRMQLSEYIDFILGIKNETLETYKHLYPYAAFNYLEGLEQYADLRKLMPESFHSHLPVVWVGPKGSMTPLHNDKSGHTFFVQLVGRKEFLLIPEEDTKCLYKSDIFDFMSLFSRVNLDKIDYKRFPKIKNAKYQRIVLNPGDTLIIPDGMWHEARAIDDSISVCCRAHEMTLSRKLRYFYWYSKAFLHLAGLYKRSRCLCHIVPWDEADLAVHNKMVRFLAKHGLSIFHGKDLAELLEWEV